MFGHESKPSRIYSYGANAPTVNAELVDQQMRLAHAYRNKLVEQELARRAKVDEALLGLSEELRVLEPKIKEADAKVDQAYVALKQQFVKRQKREATPEEKKDIAELKKARLPLYAERKSLRAALFKTDAWKPIQDKINAWDNEQKKALRAASGLFWGTYLAVEGTTKDISKGPPPRRRPWDGYGKVAVQIQGGLPVTTDDNHDALMGCQDTRLRLAVPEEGVWVRGSRKPAPGSGVRTDTDGVAMRKLGTAVVSMRVGSNGRAPIWAEIPIHLDRPLPADGTIKWAWLIRYRVGLKFEWKFQFVVSKDVWERDRAQTGRVGIDLGWRLIDDKAHPGEKCLRVAVWSGSDGKEGELTLPAIRAKRGPMAGRWVPWHEANNDTIRGLESVMSKNMDSAKAKLVQWLKSVRHLPAWLLSAGLTKKDRDAGETALTKEATLARLACWRSPRRLDVFALQWAENRFMGDEKAFAALTEWRKQDRHLFSYAKSLRAQLIAQRSDLYRVFAASMGRRYKTVVLEGEKKEEKRDRDTEEDEEASTPILMDLRPFHELPPAEKTHVELGQKDSIAKKFVRDACLSDLRKSMKEAVAELIVVPAGGTTFTCSNCKNEEVWDQKILTHTCSKCRKTWDQDYNAARNLLGGMKPTKKKGRTKVSA